MKNFNYLQPTEIVFGKGRLAECGSITAKYGNKVLLVTVPVFDAIKPMVNKTIKILQESGLKVTHFDGVIPNPTTESITQGADLAKKYGANVIVGLGGGSSMDTAKAIAVETVHEGSAWDYLFYKKEPGEKTLPVIAISTTSGTGSQVTQVSVLTSTKERDKSAIFHVNIFPKVALVDPELMLTIPPSITAPTGFDAFTHAFEAIIHSNTSAYVQLLAKEAVRLVINNLPTAVQNGNDIKARTALAWADTLAGLSIANAGVTLPHGMGMAIGGMYPNVAHGQGLAIIYPAFIDYTKEHATAEFAFLARTLNPELSSKSDREAANSCRQEIEKFLDKINLRLKLRDMQVPENELDELARQCLVLPDYQANPRVATLDEIKKLLHEIY
jgi:alcohol dehydrogenase